MRTDLQILRGIAVTSVILYHLNISIFANGFLGVDIFFVLSGFLMESNARRFDAKTFLSRRIKRLIPSYLVALMASLAVVSFLCIGSDAQQVYDRGLYHLLGLSNISFWFDNSYFDSHLFKPLGNFWSLGLELQFYLTAPFVFRFIHKYKYPLRTFVLLIVSSLIINSIFTNYSPKTSFYLLPARFSQFLIGGCVSHLVAKYKPNPNRLICYSSIIFIGLIIFFGEIKPDSFLIFDSHPGLYSFLISIFTGIYIFTSLDSFYNKKNILVRGFKLTGDYSYALYLTHYPVFVLYCYKSFSGTYINLPKFIDFISVITITCLLTFLLHHFVERINRSAITKFRIGILYLCTAVVIYSGEIVNKARFTEEENKIFQAWFDKDEYRCGKLFRIFSPNDTCCEIKSNKTNKRLLLVGNSHADAIKSAVGQICDQAGFSLLLNVRNTPLMGDNEHIQVFNEIQKYNITHVAIHFSKSFFENENYCSELAKLLRLCELNGIPNSILPPLPSYPFSIPKALYENLQLESPQAITQSFEEYKKRNETFDKFIRDNDISLNKIFHIADGLIYSGNYITILNGTPLYRDGSHISETGSLKLDYTDLRKFLAGAENL